MMKNILVTVGFDKNEKLLIDNAFQLAKAFNSKIWLIHVASPDPDFVGFEAGPQHVRDIRANELRKEHKIIQGYVTELKEKGIIAESLLIQGQTIKTIIEKSKKLDIELIIIGYHEHSFLYKSFFGNTSTQIIKKSKIPVLIVPLY